MPFRGITISSSNDGLTSLANGFDSGDHNLAEILAKYEEEKEKRMQPEGTEQYIDVGRTPKFEHFVNDPFIHESPYISQPCPVSDGSHVKVLIIGAGYGALMFAVRLVTEAGFKPSDIAFVDTAWGFGGTWYWNRYPGLMCDVESACYMPLVEEMEYVPKHRYSKGPELREYAELVAEKWELSQRAVFGSTAKSTAWVDGTSEWETTITRRLPNGSETTFKVRSDFFILTSGLQNRPKVARVDGIENYQGHIFHSSRWDYNYTGGTPENPTMDKLAGKKVAFIGTGATAIQAIPQLAKWAGHLNVFQRTASGIDARGQREVDPERFKEVVATGKGWQQARRENMAAFLSNHPDLPAKNLVNDGWTHFPSISGIFGSPRAEGLGPENLGEYLEYLHKIDLPRQARIREATKKVVNDPATAESLLPWYPGWCKGPGFNDDYLQTFNLPNVQLVDTQGRGIDSFNERGVLFNGNVYDADVVILGTGFESHTAGSPAFRAGMTITGRDGLSMEDKWEQGPQTLHGVITRGFPNLLMSGYTQAGATVNIVHCMDILAKHASYMINSARKQLGVAQHQKVVIEPTEQAEEQWAMMVASNAFAYAAVPGCTPGAIRDAEGEFAEADTPEEQLKMAKGLPWGLGIVDFTRKIEDWEAQGDLSELDIHVV